MDPEAVFSSLFGGEKFQDIIGTISLGQEMKSAMQEVEDGENGAGEGGEEEEEEYEETIVTSKPGQPGSKVTTTVKKKRKKELTPEQKAKKLELERKQSAERARARAERVSKLETALRRKLAIYTEQAAQGNTAEVAKSGGFFLLLCKGLCKLSGVPILVLRIAQIVCVLSSFITLRHQVRAIWSIEAEELKDESYGVELLHAVGATYISKAKHHLAASGTPLGIGGWFHGARNNWHVLGETYSTVRSALELKAVFEELQNAENNGLSEEKRKELEEKAATKGLAALFKGAKLEVESVIREVCEKILSEPGMTESQLERRAVGLQILGEVYSAVKKDDQKAAGGVGDDAEYVRVDKK